MRVALRHRQGLMAHQFLQCPDVHSPHSQMRSISMPQVVEPKISDARLLACRSEAVFDIPDVVAVPISENIA